ncbi:hypothetical protein COCON_G00197090 [Conger conger]|uniref:Translationally-controlled tumor protein homolog n=1 Tax=Conger conger TaxID=82655 RepID=A0A9Q1HR36_CONCO|nr:translationally-controlled tumor protein homolog [Conger conger]KAJ8255845.1 hypothetical protein COCON_G00197090 [Conger conger]
MKLYRDIISGDEMFSDIYKITESPDGVFYEVEGKLVTRSDNIDESVFAGNPSAEGSEQCDDGTSVSGVDIVLNHKLQSVAYTKDAYKGCIKGYTKMLRDRLAADNPEKAKDFVVKAQKEFKSYILPKLKECEYFLGESMNHDAMVALLDYREDGNTPYMIFFKDGLEMEKC